MRTLTDLSQLTKSMVKKSVEEPKPAPKMQESPVDREAAEVLAYFARPGGNAPQRPHVAAGADPTKDRVAELEAALEYPPGRRPAAKRAATRGAKDAALAKLAEEKAAADMRIAELERMLADEREAHLAAVRERDRLQGECGRLSGELRKTAQEAPPQAAPIAQSKSEKPTRGLLEAHGAIVETFAGETRELVLATLADALDTARQSGRERRAEVLAGVLAANRPTGELERRKAELRQILKDNGYFNDPRPLERLCMKLISGRNHWKLQYGNVRVTLAKTPSDFRANLNSTTEIANRCF